MKKGKLFEIIEKEYDEDKVRNFINMNGKMKPYCPVSFADCETEKTKIDLIDKGYGFLLEVKET